MLKITNKTTILDPAAGRGIFLVEIIKYAQANSLDLQPENVYYNDNDPGLVAFFRKVNKKHKLGIPPKNITCSDALTREWNMKFDIIVGNPPYQSATGSIGGGATPLYIRFVQQSQQLINDNGIIALVTPPTAFKIGMGNYVEPEEVITINNDAGKYFKVGSSIWYFIQQKGRSGSTDITKHGKKFTVNINPDTILTAENKVEHGILTKIQRYSSGASMKGVLRNVSPLPENAVFFRRLNRNKTFNAILTYKGMENEVKLNADYTLVHQDAAKIVETLNSHVYTFLWTRYQTSPFITLEWIRSLHVPIHNINEELGFTPEEISYLDSLKL